MSVRHDCSVGALSLLKKKKRHIFLCLCIRQTNLCITIVCYQQVNVSVVIAVCHAYGVDALILLQGQTVYKCVFLCMVYIHLFFYKYSTCMFITMVKGQVHFSILISACHDCGADALSLLEERTVYIFAFLEIV